MTKPPYEKPPHDLRDYLLDELDEPQRAEVESYLDVSPEAREELERLKLTHAALVSVPDEEIPRRVAFVSDKVFEPSPAKRIWREIWAGAPRLAFGLAAVVLAVFVGLSAAQPTITVDDQGWRVAFGAPPEAPTEARTATPQPASLTAEQARALFLEVAAQRDDGLREELRQIIAERMDQEAAARKAQMQHVTDLSGETYQFLSNRIEDINNTFIRMDMASLGR